MNIAIVGAGAIGGYLGARLSLAGADVTFIARGANLQALQTQGIILIEEDGTEKSARPVKAQAIADAGQYDYVLLTLKSHQVASVCADVARLCHDQSAIVTLQNGLPWWYFYKNGGAFENTRLKSVDSDDTQWQMLGPQRIIGSVVYPACELIAPGVVKVIEGNRFTLGEPSGEKTERVLTLAKALIDAGFKSPVSSNIRDEIWVKLWGNLTFNPVSALTHATLEEICRFEPSREVARAMMREAQTIGEKIGVQFKIALEKRIEGAEKVGAHKTSMLQDVELGKALELEALVGSVVELARITDTPAPTIATVYALTRLLAQSLAKHDARLMINRG
jgi:2-dehydropantoate 2-reductase